MLALVILCIEAFARVVLAGLNPWLLPTLICATFALELACAVFTTLVIVSDSTSLSRSLNATTSLTFADNSCLLICVTACSKLLAFAKSTSTLVFDVVV